jgi:HAE1 family hydrophobic/amphiphilic exporter-1
VDGTRVTSFQAEDDERWVAIRFPELPGLSQLDEVELTVPGKGPILLRDVVRPVAGEGAREIYRKDQSRVGIVGAQVVSGVPFSRATAEVQRALASMELPSGYRATFGGEEEQRRDTLRQLTLAALLALVLIYMVLASLFESLVHPFTIMLTVPLALIGVALGLALWGLPLGVMAAIGSIMLAGIAVNNSILLVDYAGDLRRCGRSVHEALVEAAETRLRPILMTTLTTVLALAPLAFGFGTGASLRAPLAVAVIGGLAASTLVTLFVVPCLYSLLDRLRPARVREGGSSANARAGLKPAPIGPGEEGPTPQPED